MLDPQKLEAAFAAIDAADADSDWEKELASKELLPYLFEVMTFEARRRLGVPIQQGDRANTDVPEEKREALQAAFRDCCRDVAGRFVAAGDLVTAWAYFRAAGLKDDMARALEAYEPDRELVEQGQTEELDAVIEIAFQQGVHPVRGYELILENHGTCDGITHFERRFPFDLDVRRACASRLTRQLHGEVRAQLVRAIEAKEGSAPAEGTTLTEMVKGREWLFERGYHVDDSHLQAVIRIGATLREPAEAELAIELCDYGAQLPSPENEPPPFVDFYNGYRRFLAALIGIDVDSAVEFFTAEAREAGPGRDGNFFAAQILVHLLERVGRYGEAVERYLEFLSQLENPPTIAPPLIRLCELAGEVERLKAFARERNDLLLLCAARVLEQKAG